MRPYFILLLACIILTGRAAAQSVSILHFNTESGLPTNMIYGSFCDSKGYLWLATDKGAARFNGSRFTIYTTSDGINDNEVFSFREDEHNRLWLLCFKGDLCYYKDGAFHSVINTPWLRLPQGTPPFYGKFTSNSDSTYTGVSADNKAILQIKNEQVKLFRIEAVQRQLPSGTQILFIRKTSASTFRLWYTDRILDIDTNNRILRQSQYHGRGYGTVLASGSTPYLANDTGIYTLNEKPLYLFNTVRKHLTSMFYPIDQQNVLVGLDSFLYLNRQLILKNVYVTSVTRDFSGNFWVSTKNDGVYYLSGDLLGKMRMDSSYSGKVRNAEKFGSSVYFVTEQDHFYRLQQDKISTLYHNPGYIDPRTTTFFNIHYLIWDSLTYVKMHDQHKFKVHINAHGQAERSTIPEPWGADREDLKSTIKGIVRLNDDLYVSTISRLFRIPYATLTREKRDIKTVISAANDWSLRIASRAANPYDQHIWISRIDGVFRLSDTTLVPMPGFKGAVFRQFGFWGHYLVAKTDNNRLLICSNYDNNPVIATIEGNNCIWERIYPVDEMHLIISTNNFYRLLTLYPSGPGARPRYSVKVIEDPFLPQQAEFIIADSNYCHFFKDGTIFKINTDILFRQTPPPAPVFTSFKSKTRTYPLRDNITIPYEESRNINIVFDNISFLSKEVSCEYSITQGGREEWVATSGNEINLNAPGFGEYTIKIRSKTLSSGYSTPIVLHLTILSPYWATWWFIALCILALVALVWCVVLIVTWMQLRKKQKEHEADMKYQQSEYKALNALMNPHFIFNSLNNIQGLINKDEKRTANEYLVIFSDLVRQNMNNLSKGFISLQQELNLVENYLNLEKLRFKDLVNYEIRIDDEVETEDILIPPLMIQPLVENAVKHGLLPKQAPGGQVRIHVFEKNNLLYIEIEDNGIGLTRSLQSKSRLYESFGLVNLKKRTEHLRKIQQHEIEIEVTEITEDGEIKGTRASIKMSLDSF